MLQMRQEQIDTMATVPQDIFVIKMAEHLTEVCQSVCPDKKDDFTSDEALTRIRAEMNDLLQHGFYSESDLAEAIEFFELYEIDRNNPETRLVIEHRELTITEKLENFWNLMSQKGEMK